MIVMFDTHLVWGFDHLQQPTAEESFYVGLVYGESNHTKFSQNTMPVTLHRFMNTTAANQ